MAFGVKVTLHCNPVLIFVHVLAENVPLPELVKDTVPGSLFPPSADLTTSVQIALLPTLRLAGEQVSLLDVGIS